MKEKFECPLCAFKGNTSEMIYDKKYHSLNCPACNCPVIENYKEKPEEKIYVQKDI